MERRPVHVFRAMEEDDHTTRDSQTFGSLSNSSTKPIQVFLPCNNPDNLIDEETVTRLESVFHMGVLPSLELFGVTTNVISCIIFARQGLKDRINLCLFALAVADISFLMLMFAAKFFSFLSLFDDELGEYWSKRYLGTVLGPLAGTMTISHVMTMIISLERCICVSSPFKAKKILKTRHMAIAIVIMSAYILGVYSLLDMKYVTVRVTDPVTNTSRWVSRLSAFYSSNRLVIDVLYHYLLILAVPSLSLAAMIVATAITVCRLKQSLAWRHERVNVKESLAETRETAVTKMLTVVCVIYMVSVMPSLIHGFVRTFVPEYTPAGRYCNIHWTVQILAHTCEVTNSSVNFVVYFSMGSKYRQTLRQLTGRWRDTNHAPSSALTIVRQSDHVTS